MMLDCHIFSELVKEEIPHKQCMLVYRIIPLSGSVQSREFVVVNTTLSAEICTNATVPALYDVFIILQADSEGECGWILIFHKNRTEKRPYGFPLLTDFLPLEEIS